MIHTFVLILTLVGASSNGHPPAPTIETIPFPDKASCLAAGTAWLKQVSRDRRLEARALCVPQS